jgi:beta-lactamase class A
MVISLTIFNLYFSVNINAVRVHTLSKCPYITKETGMDRKDLQQVIRNEIISAAKVGAEISLLVKDFNTQDILYSHEETRKVVSASIIKVPIMLTALEQVQEGKVKLDSLIELKDSIILEDTEVFEYGGGKYTLKELLAWMIIESDNTATNCLIDFFSMETINIFCKKLSLNSTRLGRRMLDFQAVKEGRNNYTSAKDMAILYEKLYNKTILTPDLCDTALDILKRQRHKQLSLRYIYDDIRVAHKTGSLDNLNHDAGIFYLPHTHYYFGAFVWNAPGNAYAGKWIGRISKGIYEYYKTNNER